LQDQHLLSLTYNKTDLPSPVSAKILVTINNISSLFSSQVSQLDADLEIDTGTLPIPVETLYLPFLARPGDTQE
jgi:hypothetical protein